MQDDPKATSAAGAAQPGQDPHRRADAGGWMSGASEATGPLEEVADELEDPDRLTLAQ